MTLHRTIVRRKTSRLLDPACMILALVLALLAALAVIARPVYAADLAPSAEVKLRGEPAVSGETITLGDIFDGTGDAAATPVAASPLPGHSLLVDASSLATLLSAHHLIWAQAGTVSAVRVERLAREIGDAEITGAVAAALSKQSGRNLEARLLQGSLTLRAPVTAKDPLAVEILTFDDRSGRFEAIVRAPGGDGARLSGIAEEVMDIPVLARPIQRGETIADADLAYVHTRIAYLSRNTVTDAKGLVGFAAKRPLRSGQPIQLSDIEHPVIVAKGALVTIVYEVPGLSLTDQGRALEPGATGDTISVLNPNSHRTLLATVVSSDRVRLEPSSLAGANLARR